jgi:hypothetical protein
MTLSRPMFPPVDPTRRRFLSQAAGVAAGGSALALATIPPVSAAAAPASLLDAANASPDPVFGAIEARKATLSALDYIEAHDVSDEEVSQAVEDDNVALWEITAVVPTTLAGIIVWVNYINDIVEADDWRVEDGNINLAEVVSGLVSAFRSGVGKAVTS